MKGILILITVQGNNWYMECCWKTSLSGSWNWWLALYWRPSWYLHSWVSTVSFWSCPWFIIISIENLVLFTKSAENILVPSVCTFQKTSLYLLHGFLITKVFVGFNSFQEVVPLNAGNVLGAEDNTPIQKWEAIIRRSLNKSSEPDSKHKSYSAPPSPVLRTSSAADLLADTIDVDNPIPIDMMIEELVGTVEHDEVKQQEVKSIIEIENNLQLRRIYGIDIDWPERSLDAIPQIVDSNSKLRRVLSSSARIGFNRTESTLKYTVGLKRSHHSSGNLGLLWEEQQVIPEVVDSVSDLLSAEGDDAFIEMVNTEDDNELGTMKSCGNPRYVRIVSKQMVGIYVSVWVQRRLRRHINNLKVSPVGVGLMGYMGNKVRHVSHWMWHHYADIFQSILSNEG